MNKLPPIDVKDEPTKVWLTPTRGYNDEPTPLTDTDLVEQTKAVIVPQCMGPLAARYIGGDDLVELEVGDGGFRGQCGVPSRK